jgi:hypothetical protein
VFVCHDWIDAGGGMVRRGELTDFDERALNYRTGVVLAAIMLWLR